MAAPAFTLPTKLEGYVDNGAFFALLTEQYENTADLIFPQSVYTYTQMKRDPQLAALLAAYTLPIRRATWTVKPDGCRDEVVQMVADDLGLPVLGVDQPTAARTRGVSWPEHLRIALGALTYGFSAFEMLAAINDAGQARLTGLYERTPQSISFIHSTPDGDLAGITQMGFGGAKEKPEIAADRIVWYANDRTGSAWHGNSILRPAFGVWLIKHELMRVLATSNRRFGMGVPTVRALPGTTVSEQQMQAAGQIAQQMRVGEEAGMALPPGFVMELQGLTGSVPATLDYIKWLDMQMSRMVLAQFLDLGSTSSHGSRSLGTAFIDMFTLSITAIAEQVADTVTRQAAARIVEWNYGPDEPVPAVTVGDIGTKHEITADVIQQLVSVGAVQPDPTLDAYLRNAFQLPPRDPTVPWERPPVKGLPVSAADSSTIAVNDSQGDVATKRTRRARKPAVGQLELPIAAARDQTPQEQTSGADQQGIADDRDKATTALVAALPALLAPIVATLTIEAGQLVASGAVSSLTSLTVDQQAVDDVATKLTDDLQAVAATSAARAASELDTIGVPVDADSGDSDLLGQAATVTAGLIVARLISSAAQTAMGHAGPGADRDRIETAVRSDLDAQVNAGSGWLSQIAAAAVSNAQHGARMATLGHADGQVVYLASELHDDGGCEPCNTVDGVTYKTFADAAKDYPAGRYVDCLGGPRCRGDILAIPR